MSGAAACACGLVPCTCRKRKAVSPLGAATNDTSLPAPPPLPRPPLSLSQRLLLGRSASGASGGSSGGAPAPAVAPPASQAHLHPFSSFHAAGVAAGAAARPTTFLDVASVLPPSVVAAARAPPPAPSLPGQLRGAYDTTFVSAQQQQRALPAPAETTGRARAGDGAAAPAARPAARQRPPPAPTWHGAPPVDWSLKAGCRLVGSSSFAWCEEAAGAVGTAAGVASFCAAAGGGGCGAVGSVRSATAGAAEAEAAEKAARAASFKAALLTCAFPEAPWPPDVCAAVRTHLSGHHSNPCLAIHLVLALLPSFQSQPTSI